jgi:hypothetical protein
VSRRSKRRRGPHAAGREGAAEAGRAAEAAGREGAAEARRAAEAAGGAPRAARQAGSGSRGRGGAKPADRPAAPGWSLGVQIAFLAAVFAVVVLVAELAGAANLGVALGIGQIAFAIAVVYLLVRR